MLCGSKGYGSTYNMSVHSGKDRKCITLWTRATDATVTELTARTENVGLKLYTDNSSPALFDNLRTQRGPR